MFVLNMTYGGSLIGRASADVEWSVQSVAWLVTSVHDLVQVGHTVQYAVTTPTYGVEGRHLAFPFV